MLFYYIELHRPRISLLVQYTKIFERFVPFPSPFLHSGTGIGGLTLSDYDDFAFSHGACGGPRAEHGLLRGEYTYGQ
jgi:hypothetical protein